MSISDPVNEGLYFHIMALATLVAKPRRTVISTLYKAGGGSLCLCMKNGIVIMGVGVVIWLEFI